MKRLDLKITDMHCSACVMRLEGLEDDLDGVQSARASYRDQRMEIEYDEGRVDPAAILRAVEDLGYTPAVL